MTDKADDDRPAAASGFSYRTLKSGTVEVLHHGSLASTLRGRDAANFLARAGGWSEPQAQLAMAKLTGNYKRGNERRAAAHPRNRG